MKSFLVVVFFFSVAVRAQTIYQIETADGRLLESTNLQVKYQQDGETRFSGTTMLIMDDTVQFKVSDVNAFSSPIGTFRRTPGGTFCRLLLQGERISIYTTPLYVRRYRNSFRYSKSIRHHRTRPSRSFFYSIDHQPLTQVRIANLRKDLKDNPLSMVELKKAENNSLGSTAFIVGGVRVFLAYASTHHGSETAQDNQSTDGPLAVSFLGSFLIAAGLQKAAVVHQFKALYTYDSTLAQAPLRVIPYSDKRRTPTEKFPFRNIK